MTFPILAEMLRTLYVDVASELLAGDAALTDSRVSLLTGIHRKELRRQRREGGADDEPPMITLNSQLIGRWLGDPTHLAADGSPAPLARSGPAPSFEALVASVTRDVRSRTVLDQWLTQGIAAIGADGLVRLQVHAFLPRQDEAGRLYYLARNLHDHAAAAAANVQADGSPPFLERAVHYDGLSADAAAAMVQQARSTADETLLLVNRSAVILADRDDAAIQAAERRWRVNFGIYVYSEEEPDAA